MINSGIFIEKPGMNTGLETGLPGITPKSPADSKFTDTLNELISDVNTLQKQSSDLTERFIKGEPVDIHDVMIASEQAKTGFQLLLELRNKFTDMYREVIRLQV
jgi:flagellar hook-basal body complex protein FliE